MVYPISKHIIIPFVNLWIRKVSGKEHIPMKGPFIIAANHQSYFDDLLVPSIVIPKVNCHIRFYANRHFFRKFIARAILKHGKAIPVASEGKDKKAINKDAFQQALQHISKGGIVGIFPEGGRSR